MKNPYNNTGDILVLVTEDCTGRKLNKKKANVNDEEEIIRIFQSFIDKYSLNIKIIVTEDKKKDWAEIDEQFRF